MCVCVSRSPKFHCEPPLPPPLCGPPALHPNGSNPTAALQDELQILKKLKAAWSGQQHREAPTANAGVFRIDRHGSAEWPVATVLWRGSARNATWRAPRATAVDWAPFALGLATEVVGRDFYAKYATEGARSLLRAGLPTGPRGFW